MRQQQLLTDGFRLLTGYSPAFSSFTGSLYEMHLIRDAIDIIATHASKLKPVIHGPGYAAGASEVGGIGSEAKHSELSADQRDICSA